MRKEQENQPHELTFAEVIQIAKETTLRNGSHVPTVIADGRQRTVVVEIDNFKPTHEERTQQMFLVGYHLAKEQLVGVLQQTFFISEGWMSLLNQGEDVQQPPASDPNRKEVLLVAGLKLSDQDVHMIALEEVRDQAGKLTELKESPPHGEGQRTVSAPLLSAFVAGYELGIDGNIDAYRR
jgi:hypothetical protein